MATRWRRALVAALLPVPLVLVACGGGTHYSKRRTATCLVRKGATVMFPTDGIAANSGGLGVMVANRNLNIAFGKGRAQAERLLREYEKGPFSNVGERGIGARIYRKANAVLAWDVPPAAARTRVEGCLR
jgi:hypothetical protein